MTTSSITMKLVIRFLAFVDLPTAEEPSISFWSVLVRPKQGPSSPEDW